MQIEARLVADDKLILEFPINKLKKADLATESSDLSPLIESPILDSSEKLLEAGTSHKDMQRGMLRPQGSKDESSSTTSSCESSSSAEKELKLGVPIFRNDEGLRRLYLTINVGNEFQPPDVMVQVC